MRKYMIALLLLFVLTACGRGAGDIPNGPENGGNGHGTAASAPSEEQAPEGGEATPVEAPPVVPRTYILTVSARYYYAPILQEAADRLTRQLARDGHTFFFAMATYGHNNEGINDYHEHLQTLFLTDQGFDLIFNGGHTPLWDFARAGFFADIFDLIDADDTLGRDDFFINVLEPFMYNGRLFALPLAFSFTYVGINTSLPPSIVERFAGYSVITLEAIHAIYEELRRDYPDEYARFALASFVDLPTPVVEMSHFIDMYNRTANLTDPRFVGMLETHRGIIEQITYRMFTHAYRVPHNPGPLDAASTMRDRAGIFFFDVVRGREAWRALFDLEDAYFDHHIPLADSTGRLVINMNHMFSSPGRTISVSAGADPFIAWEFIKHLIDVMADMRDNWLGMSVVWPALLHEVYTPMEIIAAWNIGVNAPDTAIRKDNFEERAEAFFAHIRRLNGQLRDPTQFNQPPIPYVGSRDNEERARQVANAIDTLAHYNAMPVTHNPFFPFDLYNIINGRMWDTTTPPQEIAEELQELVLRWLME